MLKWVQGRKLIFVLTTAKKQQAMKEENLKKIKWVATKIHIHLLKFIFKKKHNTSKQANDYYRFFFCEEKLYGRK